MNKLMSVFSNCKTTTPIGNTSIIDFLMDIKNEVYINEIQKLRSISDKKQRDTYKSSALKTVTYAGIFQERKNDLLTVYSGVIILDIDNVPDSKIERIKADLSNDKYTLAVWSSPSGSGLKVMVKMDFGFSTETYKAKYLCVLNYYSATHNIPTNDSRKRNAEVSWGFDLSCSDIARQCIYSADSEIYINEDSTVFDSFDTYSKAEQNVISILKLINKKKIDITAIYDDWFRIACALHHEFGEAGRSYFHSVSSFYNGYTKKEADEKFEQITKGGSKGITIATFFDFANKFAIKYATTESIKSKDDFIDADVYTQDDKEFTISPIPFPVDIFLNDAKEYIVEVSNSLACAIDLVGVAVLGAISGAIGGTREIETMSGHRQSANLYLAVIADPSSKKSPAFSQANFVVEWLQQVEKQKYDSLMDKYREELNAWERAKKENRGEKPTKPLLKQFFVSDFTMEVLSSILSENNRGIMVIADELDAWLRSMGQYKGGKGNDKQKWLTMWSRGSLKVDRKGDEPIFVMRPFVTIAGGIQPEVLRLFTGNSVRDGFIDRFLFSFPEKVLSYSNERVSSSVRDNYLKLIKGLYDYELNKIKEDIKHNILSCNNSDSFVVYLDTEANKMWDDWNWKLIEEMSNPFFPYYLEGAWGKLAGHTLRFALIFYCLNNRGRGISRFVTAEDMRCAFKLTDYFKYHIFKTMSYCNDSEIDVSVNSVYSRAKKNGGSITMREVYKNKIGGCRTTKDVEKIFEELEARKLGKVERKIPPNGGRTSIIFTIKDF